MRRSDIVGAWIIDAAKIEKHKYDAECTFRRHEHSSIHKMSPIETNPRSWKCQCGVLILWVPGSFVIIYDLI